MSRNLTNSHINNLWHSRQSKDPFVKNRATDGYRSRAAYKLDIIQKKHKILRKGRVILDLGAAPGGWTQVAVKHVIDPTGPEPGRVISIDLLPILPIPNAHILQGDMQSPEVIAKVVSVVQGDTQTDKPVVDVVLSDMAHSFTGNRTADVARVHDLCRTALEVAELPQILKPGGAFVCKFLQGAGDQELRAELLERFAKVHHEKPAASRQESAEGFFVCTGFKR
ncbi:hypothetical protein HK097_007694 [Rhizophlyctis rosea]|uniref:rRNA methyltransferase 2, mitochondrial n=1 Tax=Rhizophlyctis rosea TaxID=64517 RepID=A0AAD5X9F7_9FUNG|nr:hypothetical protein HK097_007694 [Rhizophlyctis rosea]